MADSGLEFFITRDRGFITIGATTIPVDCSSLDPEIRNVSWRGASGAITCNADAGNSHDYVPAKITDPSPYQGLINAWCTAQAAATPAIGLGQVQQIKTSFVEVLYNLKRQAPIAVTVGAGALSWEATDEAAAAMGQQLTVGIIGLLQTLATTLAADLATIASSGAGGLLAAVNTAFASLTSSVNTSVAAPCNIAFGQTNDGFTDLINYINGASLSSPSVGGTGTAVAPTVSAPTFGSAFSATLSPIAWIPSGATATVNITNIELAAILGAILARRQTLQATRLSKEAAIAALATVATAIAYDVTAGW